MTATRTVECSVHAVQFNDQGYTWHPMSAALDKRVIVHAANLDDVRLAAYGLAADLGYDCIGIVRMRTGRKFPGFDAATKNLEYRMGKTHPEYRKEETECPSPSSTA